MNERSLSNKKVNERSFIDRYSFIYARNFCVRFH